MIDLSKLRAPGWQRVVAELSAPAQDDRTFLMRLMAVLAQAAGARQAALFTVGVSGDEGGSGEPEPRPVMVWPPPSGEQSGTLPEGAVEREVDVRGGARAAATANKIEVYGLDADSPFYDSDHKGYLVAVPLASGAPEGPAPVVRHVITLLLEGRSRAALQTTLALVEVLCGYVHAHGARQALRRTRAAGAALDLATRLIASLNATPSFKGAAMQLANDLSRQLGVDRVAVGWAKGIGRGGEGASVKVVAISDTEHVDRRMAMVQKLEAAMDECFDQEQPVMHPPPPERGEGGEVADVLLAQAITHAHRELASSDAKMKVCSLPLRIEEDAAGVVTVETSGDGRIDPATIELLQSTMDLVAPVLRLKRLNDRNLALRTWDATLRAGEWLVGPKHTAWKLAGVAVMAIAILVTFVRVPYRVEAPITLEPRHKRTISAPFEGIIAMLPDEIRPGARVAAGDVLLELDTVELRLQMLEAENRRREALKRADNSRAQGKQSEVQQAEAQADAAQAEVDLLATKIERAVVRAPIAGTILAGELEERIGSSVQTGQALFEIAPLDDMIGVARVDDRDIALIMEAAARDAAEARHDLATKAKPDARFGFEMERIVPLATPEEGRNAFEVRVRLTETAPWMRPGMEGLAKFDTGRRTLIDIGTRRIRDTVRLWMWW